MRRTPLRAALILTRPPNLVTSAADALAGFAASGALLGRALPLLALASVCLYGGGIVLNDVFDSALDARERPERPIPNGDISRRDASLLGIALLALGVGAALLVGPVSGLIAVAVALCAVLYDAWGKRQRPVGPLNMGLCRGLNLMLGVSAVPAMLSVRWPLALLPIAYIGAITAVSRGEVHGGKRVTGHFALALIVAMLVGLAGIGWPAPTRVVAQAPFLVFLAYRVLPPFWRAARRPEPAIIRLAIRAGVLSLIALDAALAAGYAGFWAGLGVIALLPVAGFLARKFAVT